MAENETSAIATKVDWTSLLGVIIEGDYEIKELVEVRDDGARFTVRILGGAGRMGMAYFLQLDPREAEDQLDVWYTLREVQHPNLSPPWAVGRREVSGVDVVHAVFSDPDEKLMGVVPERPLEWEEAAEVLHSAEKGLAHLHYYGLVHGGLSPETVQAVGYTIQLNTLSVRKIGAKPRIEWEKPRYLAPESKGANTTVEADVWCLGETLFEVLTQERYGTPGAELGQLPLVAIIKRCLEKDPAERCKLKDAAAFEVETPPPPPAPVVEPPPQPAAAAEPVVTPEIETPKVNGTAPRPQQQPPPPPRPSPNSAYNSGRVMERPRAPMTPHPLTPKTIPPRTLPARQVSKEDMALVPVAKRHKRVQGKRAPVDARIRVLDPSENGAEMVEADNPAKVAARRLGVGRKNLTRNIVASVALAALFGAALWFIIIPKLQTRTEPIANGDSAQTAVVTPPGDPGTSQGISEAHTAPVAPVLAPPVKAEEKPAPAPPPLSHEAFRIVVAEFDTQAEAVHRAEILSEKYPDLFLHVSGKNLSTRNTKYMVVIGGQLTRTEASALEKRVTEKGLPVQVQRVD